MTSIITTTDSNHCNTGYDDGWNETCHIGLTKFPDPDYSCPGISKEKLQQLQNQQNTPSALLKQDEEWCKPYYEQQQVIPATERHFVNDLGLKSVLLSVNVTFTNKVL